jgi:hypothetical protein
MKSLVFSAIVLTSIVLFAPLAIAVERNIPSEYTTIQAAIDASISGDVVIIAPGTYTGAGNRDIDFLGKAITVRSIDPEDPCNVAATIIDCQNVQGHRGFYFHSGEGVNSVLSGLTIKNGYANQGGGIYCSGSSPTITYCTITGNRTTDGYTEGQNPGPGGDGGGIYYYNSSAKILECKIMNNQTGNGGTSGRGYGGSGGNGGGIYCWNYSSHLVVEINDCIISNNRTGNGSNGFSVFGAGPYAGGGGTGGNGGGIYLSYNTPAQITNCIINGNQTGNGGAYNDGINLDGHAGDSGSGGGIYTSSGNDSSPTVKNCLLTNNTTGSGGNCVTNDQAGNGGSGGAVCCYYASPAFVNCTTNLNQTGPGGTSTDSSKNGAAGGGGSVYCHSGSVTVTNCIMWNDIATQGNEMYLHFYGGDYYETHSTITVSYSDINSGQAGVYMGAGSVLNWAGTNINLDPLFASGTSGNYYLSQIAAGQATNSPCVDAGGNYAARIGFWDSSTRTDLVRDSGIVDMGYHSGNYNSDSPGNINNDCVVNMIDFAILASQWQQTPGTPSADIAPLGGDGIVDIDDLVLMAQSWLWMCHP